MFRLRGFLHAFHLVEMTTRKNDLSRGFFACALNDSRGKILLRLRGSLDYARDDGT